MIIPLKDEILRLPDSIRSVLLFRSSLHAFEMELILVDDGSIDGTAEVIAPLISGSAGVTLVRHKRNMGKGRAIQSGVFACSGDVILFSDADLSTPLSEVQSLYEKIHEGYDVVIGSRALPESNIVMRQPLYKHLAGKASNVLIRSVLGIPFKDTQCGFKMFTASAARSLFSDLRMARWSFDYEILYKAVRQKYRVAEVGVTWENSPHSTVRARDYLRCLVDLFLIRFTYSRAGKLLLQEHSLTEPYR